MVKAPQNDLRPGLSGGADAWDEGLAGVILSADYFAAVAPEPSGYTLDVTPGSYSLTGNSVSLIARQLVNVTPASYSLTGSAASLINRQVLTVTPGSYGLTGSQAALIARQVLGITPGSYALTGSNTELVYAGTAAAYELVVTPGSYSLSGSDVRLNATGILGIAPGSYSLTGNTARLTANQRLVITPSAYSVTGSPVDLTYTPASVVNAYVLDVLPGVYALAGNDAALTYSGEQASAGRGFEMVVREVRHKRLIDRVLEARAERIKPAQKRARKRARVIEVQAAEIARTGNEAQFYALMQQWLDQKPQLPDEPGIDLEQLFMAQVAMQLQRMEDARRLFEQDEEEALIALLLA